MSASGNLVEIRAANPVAELRAVRRNLTQAGDAQLLKVLALVESLCERGEADTLLTPLRGRLGVLRPARPVRFARVLFLPLDPLIVDASTWRPDSPLIPRTALQPIATLAHGGLGHAAPALDLLLGALRSTDMPSILRVGAEFWPRAARALAAAEMPPSWTAQGLPAAAFAPLCRAISFLLAAEAGLRELQNSSVEPPVREQRLEALLLAASKRSPQCWAMLLAILLQRFPDAEAPVSAAVASRPDQAGPSLADAALGVATRWIEASAAARGRSALADVADEIGRQATLLDRLAHEPPLRRRAAELRSALHAGCVARFGQALQDTVAERLAAIPDSAAVAEIESEARNLRRMETEARRLGGGSLYDALLRKAAENVMAAPQLDRLDRIRLVEILAGSAAALQQFQNG